MNKFSDHRLANDLHTMNIDPIKDRLKDEFARKLDEQVIADVITIYLDEVRNRLVAEGNVFIPFIGTVIAVDFSQYPEDAADQLAVQVKRFPFARNDIEPEQFGCFLALDNDDINTVKEYMESRSYADRMRDLEEFTNPSDNNED